MAMSETITVEAKVAGRKKTIFSDWSIPMPPMDGTSSGRTTLRDLITWTVSEEVKAFRERQEQRRLERFLSRGEIREGVRRGKVDMGGRDLQQEVDLDGAIATALQAFEDGVYFVFVDDQQYSGLDDVIYLKPDSHVLYLRLVALVGG
jgi:hypothetical protein